MGFREGYLSAARWIGATNPLSESPPSDNPKRPVSQNKSKYRTTASKTNTPINAHTSLHAPDRGSGGLRSITLAAEEGLVEQEHVQRDNQPDDHRGDGGSQAVVYQPSHQAAVAAEDQERDEGEGDAEREHDLA